MSLFLLWVFWWLRRFQSYRSGLLCLVSIIVWMLVGSSVFSHPWRWRRKIIIQEKKARLNLEVIPENHFSVFPSNLPVICFSLLLFFVFLFFVFHFWVICFLSIHYSMQYSYPIQSIHSNNNKRESCRSAICHLLSWIQQLSVGCSIFLIVANFLVQFYATFTWMFMTLSAATKI